MNLLICICLVLAPITSEAPAESIAVVLEERPVTREQTLSSDFVPAPLVEIPIPPATRQGLRLRPDAMSALLRMLEAAEQEGVILKVFSAYRSYERQQQLFERAVERYGIDQRWVAPAGASEHQLGTTVDVADAELHHVLRSSFAQTEEARWLRRRATEFGFVISYTEDNAQITGYEPEPWHLRFKGHETSSAVAEEDSSRQDSSLPEAP